MDINEFKKRIKELVEDTLKKESEFILAQEELFKEGKESQSGFIDKSKHDDVFKKEKEWQDASNKFREFFNYGVELFRK
jgi:hypothetical protein